MLEVHHVLVAFVIDDRSPDVRRPFPDRLVHLRGNLHTHVRQCTGNQFIVIVNADNADTGSLFLVSFLQRLVPGYIVKVYQHIAGRRRSVQTGKQPEFLSVALNRSVDIGLRRRHEIINTDSRQCEKIASGDLVIYKNVTDPRVESNDLPFLIHNTHRKRHALRQFFFKYGFTHLLFLT